MEDISPATASTSAPRRDNALLNQSLDDIIKSNRSQRRGDKKKPATKPQQRDQRPQSQVANRNSRNARNPRNNNKMMDTTPVTVQKPRDNRRPNAAGGKVVVRSNSGRPASFKPVQARRPNSSTPGLRQPWEKLPVAPLPAEPLKISIRNELAERSASSSSSSRRNDSMMMDTDAPSSNSHYRASSGMSVSAPAYEPRDSLNREEYRIGNRFSTQGMAIDYQLPSGASFDTRPTRRY